MAQVLAESPLVLLFRRELTGSETASLGNLLSLLEGVVLTQGPDIVSWRLIASGKFSVNSLYRALARGTHQQVASGLWKARLPLKIKVFFWQMCRDKLPTSVNIAKRNGPSNGSCVVCGEPETANHVFFQCHLARFVWSAVQEAIGQDWDPRSCSKLCALLSPVSGSARRVMWCCVGALLWALWHIRNKLTIEGVFPSHPADVIFKCVIFLQQWAPLGRRQDADLL